MTRHLLTTLCLHNEHGHVMSRSGRCARCEVFIPTAPVYTVAQRLRYEQLRTEWLHEQRALERAQ